MNSFSSTNQTLLAALGYAATARLVILHADDVGMCHGSNRAFRELSHAGLISSGSVMPPCPWAAEILHDAPSDPRLDLGVHLTLTSEWRTYRWGPLSTGGQACGLVAPDFCFWPTVEEVAANLTDAAAIQVAVDEMHSQIARVQAAGLDFTHIDAHMGAAMQPALLSHYIDLAFTYDVPVILPRTLPAIMDVMGLHSLAEELVDLLAHAEAKGLPLVDAMHATPLYEGVTGPPRPEAYEEILRALPPGITYFCLHPNAAGDMDLISPNDAPWRLFEYAYLRSTRLRDFLAEQEIQVVACRDLRDAMRSMSDRPAGRQGTGCRL